MSNSLHIFSTPEDTARAVAELLLVKSKEKNKKSIPLNVALSGGSTPKLLFQVLSNEYIDKIDWDLIRLFWVDERCVQPTHSESNYGMTYDNLLKNVPIPNSNIFRMYGEANPENEALRYAQVLENQLPIKNNTPLFDLILLGMGDDGHTASIFPTNIGLLNSTKLVENSVHPNTKQQRITLTGKIINAADQVVFMITGTNKAGVLYQILNKKPGFETYPASYICSSNGEVDFYLDENATLQI